MTQEEIEDMHDDRIEMEDRLRTKYCVVLKIGDDGKFVTDHGNPIRRRMMFQEVLDEVMQHPLVHFSYDKYLQSEGRVEILLNRMGYRHTCFWSSDKDSFGPLVRTCNSTDPDGEPVEASYG